MRRLGALVLLACSSACTTEIRIRNGLTNASLENVRWVTDENSYGATSESLEPGEVTSAIVVSPEDENASGVLHFEIVSNGRRVALFTAERFKAVAGETKTFGIEADTPSRNGVLEAARSE
jgi:hypothetical protein